MKIATLKWVFLPDLAISYIVNGQTPEEEFKAFCTELKKRRVKGYIAGVSGNIDANSVQRKLVADASVGALIAVVTDDRLVRGLVTAVSWLGVTVKSFSWQ